MSSCVSRCYDDSGRVVRDSLVSTSQATRQAIATCQPCPPSVTLQRNAPSLLTVQADGSLVPAGITSQQLLGNYIVIDGFNSGTASAPLGTVVLNLPTGADLYATIAGLNGRVPAVGEHFYVKITSLYRPNDATNSNVDVGWAALPAGMSLSAQNVTYSSSWPYNVGVAPTNLPNFRSGSLFGQSMTLCFMCTGAGTFEIMAVEFLSDNQD
jgi:hypothetical protein